MLRGEMAGRREVTYVGHGVYRAVGIGGGCELYPACVYMAWSIL